MRIEKFTDEEINALLELVFEDHYQTKHLLALKDIKRLQYYINQKIKESSENREQIAH